MHCTYLKLAQSKAVWTLLGLLDHLNHLYPGFLMNISFLIFALEWLLFVVIFEAFSNELLYPSAPFAMIEVDTRAYST